MVKNIPIIKHNNGTTMPGIGLGTYSSNGGDCKISVSDAIYAGYRHIDTAFFYENESEIGVAIKEKISNGIIRREDVFVVSKLWCHFHDPENVEKACRLSLENFGLDYIDLYLMHWPYGYTYDGDHNLFPTDASGNVKLSDVDYLETYKAMEKLIDLGLTKSIGVSNFNVVQLKRLLSNCKIKPIHNQIECHPGLIQNDLIKFCKDSDIVVTGYCPLGRPEPAKLKPDYLFDDKLAAIGAKYKKTAAQVVLRYLVEIGVVPLPKSVTKSRIEENINIFDFNLDYGDHKILESYNVGERIIPMEHAKTSKYYPF